MSDEWRIAQQLLTFLRSGQSPLHPLLDHDVHGAGVAEAYLRLGRMDVDVDDLRRHVEEEDDGRIAVEVEGLGGAVRGVRQHAVLHQAAVDEKVLMPAAAEAEAARD